MKTFISKCCIVITLALACNFAWAERAILSSNFPHYYEFNPVENPARKYWCGHAALKMVAAYKTKKVYTMSHLDTYFRANSPGGYALNRCPNQGGGWCASLYDLWNAGKINLGVPNTNRFTVAKTINGQPNYAGFLSAIKTGINIKKSPVVTVAGWDKNWNIGHTWVIIGYEDNNPNSPGDAYLFLRDNSQETPTNPEMDDWITVRQFMLMMNPHHTSTYYEYLTFGGLL